MKDRYLKNISLFIGGRSESKDNIKEQVYDSKIYLKHK